MRVCVRLCVDKLRPLFISVTTGNVTLIRLVRRVTGNN